MMKVISQLHRHVPRIVITKPQFQISTLVSIPTHQQSLQIPKIDRTIDSIHSTSRNPFFSYLGACKNVSVIKRIHALLIVHGLTSDHLFQTKLVSSYGQFGHIISARLIFDQIQSPDFYAYRVMIRWYFMNDSYAEIIRLYTCMRKCLNELDNIVFSHVLKSCIELRDIDEGRKVHCIIVKVGNPDGFVLAGLVDMYAKCRMVECSRDAFDEIIDKNVVSWTSMIGGYVQNDCAEEGLILFNRMRNGLVEGNQYTFGSIITACTKLRALHQGKWVHGYVIKNGIDCNSFLVTNLVDMYLKCGSIRDARSIVDELHAIDLVPWTAMIVGYTQSGYSDEALKLFVDKKWLGIMPNCVTFASVLSACAQSGNLKLGMSIHGLGIKLCLEDTTVTNALIDMYAKCHRIGNAYYLFDALSDKDVIAWNSIISGYSQNGSAYEALNLFHQMRSEYLVPDAVTIVAVLSACASLCALRVGSSLHAYCMKEGLLSSNIYVGTALLNLYAKCGDAKSARTVFDGMGEKNTVTWSAMIGGYGMQGDSNGSLSLFNDMLEEKLKPNDVIFTTILSACSHTGMVGEGWRHFNLMCQQFNFVPSMKHYACMVDLLARAGRLEEAWAFIEMMPIQPNVSVFGAFLNGCSLYSRFDLGEVAAKKMLELHPDKACYYVLVSNLYASDRRWSQVNQVRELMKERGLSKSAGSSQVEMDVGTHFSPLQVACLA
ncbi:pentatricopeptide repeat-containing protein At2g03380, mitochondrial [Cornus florida]|uniref:pentatricopeptide repeat-containing protein At2g03380, mitochondrial n=1 Tax=Cornus florida TaxID=4283 RepID=UPI0028A21E5B|nr:pentatricopeptide repeat-containing protein At2g03380, mitochondrial [Cornus florida]